MRLRKQGRDQADDLEGRPAWLIVGLGNPGPEHRRNRHNVGFMVLERIAREYGFPPRRRKFKGTIAQGAIEGQRTLLLKPLTFMNRSGESVGRAASHYGVAVEKVVVVHDDVDFRFGWLRVKRGGGHGGHNGLRSIHEALGSGDYLRVRVGIGRPASGDVSPHVLGDFDQSERAELPDLLQQTVKAVTCVITEGVDVAMNRFHSSSPGHS